MTDELLQEIDPERLGSNLSRIRQELEENRYGEEPAPRILAVTKSVGPRVINALQALGVTDIGENRVQVALPKLPLLEPGFRLHWIGRMQCNKVRQAVENGVMIESLDRMELAREIHRRAGEKGIVMPVLLQVNAAGETQKGGMAPGEVLPFLRQMKDLSGLRVKGLMSIMPLEATPEELTLLFREVRSLFDCLRQEACAHADMEVLSMGMSNDYLLAAREGATQVRIGRALYR